MYDEWSRTQVHEQGSPCVSEAVIQTTDGHAAAQAVCDAMDRARRFLATVATGVAEDARELVDERLGEETGDVFEAGVQGAVEGMASRGRSIMGVFQQVSNT